MPGANGFEGKRSPLGLLTHHHCAGATVPRPCKGRITSTRASPLYSNKQWVHGPSLYPPFARAGDQPQGWWWVRRRNTRRRHPFRTGPWGTWSQRPEKTPRPQRRRGSPKASPTRPPRGLFPLARGKGPGAGGRGSSPPIFYKILFTNHS